MSIAKHKFERPRHNIQYTFWRPDKICLHQWHRPDELAKHKFDRPRYNIIVYILTLGRNNKKKHVCINNTGRMSIAKHKFERSRYNIIASILTFEEKCWRAVLRKFPQVYQRHAAVVCDQIGRHGLAMCGRITVDSLFGGTREKMSKARPKHEHHVYNQRKTIGVHCQKVFVRENMLNALLLQLNISV